MQNLLHVKLLIVFSLLTSISGLDTQRVAISTDFNHSVADGEQFLKKFINGEKISETPEILMFTAPHKLCEGGCDGSEQGHIAIGFPLYIGKKGMAAYRNIYREDSEKLFSDLPNPLFKMKTMRVPFTTRKMYTINLISTVPPPTTTTVSSTIPCPLIPTGMCLKKIKKKAVSNDPTISITSIASDDFISLKMRTAPEATVADSIIDEEIVTDDTDIKISEIIKSLPKRSEKIERPFNVKDHYTDESISQEAAEPPIAQARNDDYMSLYNTGSDDDDYLQ